MARGQREQVAACGLHFTRKMLPLCLQLGPCLSVAHSGLDGCLHASPPRSRQDVHSVGRASQSSGFVWKGDACWDCPRLWLGCRGRAAGRCGCRVPSGACAVSPQAAGSVPGAEGVHAVPPGGGLLPGPGAHRRRPAHAHASRGTATRLRGTAGTSWRLWGPLGGADEWGARLRATQSAPGVLC